MRKDYGIGTMHYSFLMSAHASQTFSTYTSARDCTDSNIYRIWCAWFYPKVVYWR